VARTYKSYKALVFDFDGTLVNSISAHLQAWQDVMAGFGVYMEAESFRKYVGTSPWEICATLAEEHHLSIDIEAVTEKKARRYLEYLDRVTLIEPVVQIAREQYGKVPLAVATGNLQWVAEETLKVKGIRQYFELVLSSKDMPQSKPAPDVYLEAARRMGISPRDCCAFEDSPVGLQAARDAGMDVVNVHEFFQVPR